MLPVNTRALLARVNRRIAADGVFVRGIRPGTRSFEALGKWHIADLKTIHTVKTHIDLEQYARDLGVLRDDEYLEG